MTKLKTLKEIGQSKRTCCSIEEDYSNICEKCLKQEAIKWAKIMEKRGKKKYGKEYKRQFLFMHFFNITEEDLK